MDHYKVLGVDNDATQEDIKKAYRRLASKHHPDKGGDAEEFRNVQQAYEILSDPDTRSQYDNPNSFNDFVEMFTHSKRNSGFQDFNTAFNSKHFRNPDATVNIRITLIQAYEGADLVVDTGFSKENIRIAPGTRNGTRLRVTGKGYNRYKDAAPGDLVIRILIEQPIDIDIDNNDVIQTIKIGAFDAMLGSEISVTHFSGKQLKVKIPAGSQIGNKLRLTGWGMPDPVNPLHKGNLYLILDIVIPNITDPEHITLLNKVKSEVIK